MVSIPFLDRTNLGGGLGAFLLLGTLFLLGVSSCDPLAGTGPGTAPDPKTFIHVDAATRTAVVTLIAGHPATDIQFNYDGYGNGALVLTVPTEWQVTIQCVNHGTVPNSCAVVADGEATAPVQPGWSTSNPRRGLDPGQSASFTFTAAATGSYRIASLVDGNEASGMWADLEIGAGGIPNLIAQ
jgi:Sulfocyanin (SoxE) domain